MKETALTNKLIAQKRSGLEQAITLYTPYVARVVFNATGGVLGAEDMEEVVSDTFLLLWQNAHRLKPDHSIKPYLAAIARNTAKNKLRGRRTSLPLTEAAFLPDACDLEAQLAEEEKNACLQRMLSELPEPEREIMLRYYFRDQTVREIAQGLNLSVSGIKIKLHRSRKRIKEALSNHPVFSEKEVAHDEKA